MSAKTQYKLKEVIFITAWWILSSILYVIIRGGENSLDAIPGSISLSILDSFLFSILGGLIIGIKSGLLEIFIFPSMIKNKSFGYSVGLKTIVFALLIIFVIFSLSILYGIVTGFDIQQVTTNVMAYLRSMLFFSMVFYLLVCSSLLSFIMQMNKKFGPGILWKLIIGTYHHPKEENRIFMFLDLHDSTHIAESLGHIQFSYLLQECFNDLSEILLEYEASIYQYVGDEAVLTWPDQKGIKDANCLMIYFAFETILEKKKESYQQKYGFHPFFKASINMGKVTVAEVGEIKSEIAFHGDVLNTAARVQGLCNVYNEKILITETVVQALENYPEVEAFLIDQVFLRGKNHQVNIYSAAMAVERPEPA